MNLLASATLFRGAVPDLSFVPPMQRRRLSPLQRIFFHLAAETEPLMTDEIEHRLRQAKAAEAWHALIVARRRNLKLYNSNTEE